MKQSKFIDKQITYALREVERGRRPADVCRQLGVREATFNVWKRKYARLGASDLRRLRRLEQENKRLKSLVANLTLEQMLGHPIRAGRPERTPSRRVAKGVRHTRGRDRR